MRRRFTLPLVFFAVLASATATLTFLDLIREPAPVSVGEIAIDLADKLVLILAVAAIAWTVYGLREVRGEQRAISNNLARMAMHGEAWRRERKKEIAALGAAIGDQFTLWRLSPAEADIAGLMLKGMSLKEIALARDTSEATIRQQAQAIYRKSGLSGRAELSAYFLESLFERVEANEVSRSTLSLVGNSNKD